MPNCLIYRPRRIANRKSVTFCVSLYGGVPKIFGKVPPHLRRYFNSVILSCSSNALQFLQEVAACLAPGDHRSGKYSPARNELNCAHTERLHQPKEVHLCVFLDDYGFSLLSLLFHCSCYWHCQPQRSPNPTLVRKASTSRPTWFLTLLVSPNLQTRTWSIPGDWYTLLKAPGGLRTMAQAYPRCITGTV